LLSSTVAGGLVIRDAGASQLSPEAAAMKNVSNSVAGLGLAADPDAVAAAAATTSGSAVRPRPATELETFFMAAASGLSSLAPASRMTRPPATVEESRATGTTNCRPREGLAAGLCRPE